MKDDYTYIKHNWATYTIRKNSEVITSRTLSWSNLNFLQALTCNSDSEKCVGRLLKKAHKLAKLAIKNLNKYATEQD